MPAMTNMGRGGRAKMALEKYYRKRLVMAEDIHLAVQDMMTDMMHLVRLTPGVPPFNEIGAQAWDNHEGERRDYPDTPKDWRPGMVTEE